jgi:hypothetical protein
MAEWTRRYPTTLVEREEDYTMQATRSANLVTVRLALTPDEAIRLRWLLADKATIMGTASRHEMNFARNVLEKLLKAEQEAG